MPELPEVETTRRGLEPRILHQHIRGVKVRNPALRWSVVPDLGQQVTGTRVEAVTRRGKYLLLRCGRGTLIIHLGMSGSLRLVPAAEAPDRHEHFDLELENGLALRLKDPRRFGAVIWEAGDPARHPLLAHLGPEPLSPSFSAGWLYRNTRSRSAAIKQALMDSRLVVGVGNIYASEALFRAGINPRMPARRIGLARCEALVKAIRKTLQLAIRAGGSSLRDFVNSDGELGYFQLKHLVYGREGQPCRVCGTPIRAIRQGHRSTFYCSNCQKR